MTRSSIYKLLSLMFRYPTPELFEDYRTGDFMAELDELIRSVRHLAHLASEMNLEHNPALAAMNLKEFEVRYVETFDVGAPEPPCPPYEGAHRSEERTAIMLEVSEFYKHFGLKMTDQEGKRDLPDHLSAELEFLHFLNFKEDQARREGTQELLHGYLLGQKDFMERHLVQWVPKFVSKLERSCKVELFARAAGLLARVLAADLEYVAAQVEATAIKSSAESGA